MKRTLATVLLSVGFITPMVVRADEHEEREHRNRTRYYDPVYKDYHNWDDREDHAYREYLKQQNREYRDYSRANRKEQRDYWKWRHEHIEENH